MMDHQAAKDVNGASLREDDTAVILATPRQAMRLSKDTDPAHVGAWLMQDAVIRKVTGIHKAIISVSMQGKRDAIVEINTVNLERRF